ncbi:IS3 family transposase [Methylocystis sp. WRRC1]|uniref:IS3 family transposase n=1 Tax=Methylocystis sp. WRRC1 TaxID=1732014 RepID=UPI001D14DD3D|nr:IS3 family transposase [Methylocystis sp. WRRC1]
MVAKAACVDARPTYGYRRICALGNCKLPAEGRSPVNMKRIWWIMKGNGLTLERRTARRPGRAHDGKVITIRTV